MFLKPFPRFSIFLILFSIISCIVMAWLCSARDNTELINNLVSSQLIKNSFVAQALKSVDRGHYTLPNSDPYMDAPQSIGLGVTISAPHMHGMCLDLCAESILERIKKLDDISLSALDVGSGSGYLVSGLARLFKLLINSDPFKNKNSKAIVYGIEHYEQLVKFSLKNINNDQKDNLVLDKDYKIILGDGRKGYELGAPYDCIHVGAATGSEDVLETLKKQLKYPGGRLILPFGKFSQTLVAIDRISENQYVEKNICGVQYVPLN